MPAPPVDAHSVARGSSMVQAHGVDGDSIVPANNPAEH